MLAMMKKVSNHEKTEEDVLQVPGRPIGGLPDGGVGEHLAGRRLRLNVSDTPNLTGRLDQQLARQDMEFQVSCPASRLR